MGFFGSSDDDKIRKELVKYPPFVMGAMGNPVDKVLALVVKDEHEKKQAVTTLKSERDRKATEYSESLLPAAGKAKDDETRLAGLVETATQHLATMTGLYKSAKTLREAADAKVTDYHVHDQQYPFSLTEAKNAADASSAVRTMVEGLVSQPQGQRLLSLNNKPVPSAELLAEVAQIKNQKHLRRLVVEEDLPTLSEASYRLMNFGVELDIKMKLEGSKHIIDPDMTPRKIAQALVLVLFPDNLSAELKKKMNGSPGSNNQSAIDDIFANSDDEDDRKRPFEEISRSPTVPTAESLADEVSLETLEAAVESAKKKRRTEAMSVSASAAGGSPSDTQGDERLVVPSSVDFPHTPAAPMADHQQEQH